MLYFVRSEFDSQCKMWVLKKKMIYDTFKMRADKWRSTERMESDTYIVHQICNNNFVQSKSV